MPCTEWNHEWIGQLYDELDADEARRLEAHTATCAECRETLQFLTRSRELLRESMPAVPATPRVVILEPNRPWLTAWGFAAGAACMALVFGLGLFARGSAPAEPLEASTQPTAVPAAADLARLDAAVRAFETRLAQVESSPEQPAQSVAGDATLTQAQFREEIDRVQRRFDRERAKDLEYLLEFMSAAELRTDNWIDRTQEALTYLAMRQDPRISER